MRARGLRRAVILALGCLVFGGAAASDASDLRTATATVRFPSPIEPAFPGLKALLVRYDGEAGVVVVTAQLRSAMADPSATSALHNTRLEATLSVTYGEDLFADACDWSIGDGVFLAAELESGTASLGALEGSLTVSPDRRTLTLTFGPDPYLVGRNFICLRGNLSARLGRKSDPYDGTPGALFDGFAPTDGSVGLQAAADLSSQFTYLYNDYVPRSRARFLTPTGSCSPPAGAPTVRCRMTGVIGSIGGKPRLTVGGSRTYRLIRGSGLFKEDRGKVLRWEQALRATLHWANCPEALRSENRRRACNVRVVWRGQGRLADVLEAAMARRKAATHP